MVMIFWFELELRWTFPIRFEQIWFSISSYLIFIKSFSDFRLWFFQFFRSYWYGLLWSEWYGLIMALASQNSRHICVKWYCNIHKNWYYNIYITGISSYVNWYYIWTNDLLISVYIWTGSKDQITIDHVHRCAKMIIMCWNWNWATNSSHANIWTGSCERSSSADIGSWWDLIEIPMYAHIK